MLILPIKKKWFDMIASGEKKEEYREIKPYYDSRFMNAFGFILVGGQMIYGDAAPEEIRKSSVNAHCILEKASRNGELSQESYTTC